MVEKLLPESASPTIRKGLGERLIGKPAAHTLGTRPHDLEMSKFVQKRVVQQIPPHRRFRPSAAGGSAKLSGG